MARLVGKQLGEPEKFTSLLMPIPALILLVRGSIKGGSTSGPETLDMSGVEIKDGATLG